MRRFLTRLCVAMVALVAGAQAQSATAVPSATTALRQELVDEQASWGSLKEHRNTALALLDEVHDSRSLRHRLEQLFQEADTTCLTASLAAADDKTSQSTWKTLSQTFGQHLVTMAKLQVRLSNLEHPAPPTPQRSPSPLPESDVLKRLAWMATRPPMQPAWEALLRLADRDATGMEEAEKLATKLDTLRQQRAAVAATARGDELAELRRSAQADLDAVLAEIIASAPAAAVPPDGLPTAVPTYDLSRLRAYLHSVRESMKLQGQLTRDLAAD